MPQPPLFFTQPALLALAILVLLSLPVFAADPMRKLPGDRVFGSETAPIAMIEYHSLDCLYCAKFHAESYPQLKRHYIDTGLVRFIYRDFPLSWAALEAAILTHCAPPEHYFAVFDKLLKMQGRWTRAESTAKAVAQIGETEGVTTAQYQACLDERKWEQQIYHGQRHASEVLGVTATPTFFINGEKLEGNISFDKLAKGLDYILNDIQRDSPNYTRRDPAWKARGFWLRVSAGETR